jgi:hypothetical protein
MGEFPLVSGQNVTKAPCSRKPANLPPTREDHRARFYADYHKVAEEYDKEFMKKYDEDLNTTLIFVSFVCCSGVRPLTPSQAGLFSAVASAFIIEVNSQLQPDPNDETAALLRVLIHKIDNTTFGDHPPTLPQWTGPPHAIVHVQAILFASLAASLFSAFLAMLGKQWLNRYASIEMRGSAIERSQNRQRKLDGIVTWYFDHVMESLPLMLQVALLLLGCALTRYLWEINLTVAAVILGATSFGVVFYIFIVVAGAASESCPYQTPGARIFRHVLLPALRLAISKFPILVSYISRNSRCCRLPIKWWSSLVQPWYSMGNITNSFLYVLIIPIVPAFDAYLLGRAIVRSLAAFNRMIYRPFVGASSPQTHGWTQKATASDLRCISWTIQTSLDKAVHLSTLKHLATTTSLADSEPTLLEDCFDIFISCINVSDYKVVTIQGLEELATASVMCCLRAISHLLVMDPASSVLEDIRQRYTRVFPANFPAKIDFHGYRFSHTLNAIHRLFIRNGERLHFEWSDYTPPGDEHTMVALSLIKLVQGRHQWTRPWRVPRWILRFALHSLSLDPLPLTSVITDCLMIIAIGLGSDVSKAGATATDERQVHISQPAITLTLNQCAGRASCEPDNSGPQNDG